MDTRTLYRILYRNHIILVIYWVSYYIQLYRLIGNMHVLEDCRMPEFELDIKYSFKDFISDNGVLYGRRRTVETHAFQIIRKTWQSWMKFKAKVTRSFFALCLHVQTSYGKSQILRQLLPFVFEKAMCRIVNHHLVLSWFYSR